MQNKQIKNKRPKRHKRIDPNLEVIVANNTRGAFVYSDRGLFIELGERGDSAYLTFGELRRIASSNNRAALQNMYLVLEEVLPTDEDDDVTVQDVIEQLRLDSYYSKTKELLGLDEDEPLTYCSFIEFISSATPEEIAEATKDPNLKEVMVQLAVELSIQNDLEPSSKLQVVLEAAGVENFYDYYERIQTLEE